MNTKKIILAVLSALFMIFSYLAYSYLMVGISFYLIFPSVLVFLAVIYRGKKLLSLPKLFGYIAVLNWLFVGFCVMFNTLVNVFKFNSIASAIAYIGSLLGLF
jgi:hypothetical protein